MNSKRKVGYIGNRDYFKNRCSSCSYLVEGSDDFVVIHIVPEGHDMTLLELMVRLRNIPSVIQVQNIQGPSEDFDSKELRMVRVVRQKST